ACGAGATMTAIPVAHSIAEASSMPATACARSTIFLDIEAFPIPTVLSALYRRKLEVQVMKLPGTMPEKP
ncbi:hypothetical protein LI230_16145, partial [Anaerostipes caccae]|nr:hypothetical protein [Anaerostipes caccae]